MNKRIMKSLTCIVAVVTGGWFVTSTCITVMMRFLSLTPIQQVIANAYSGIFINFGCACNFFILYKCR